MGTPRADRGAAARVAVVGAESPEGALLREALADSGIPGARVDLYGKTNGEAVLSEYDGEARLIQEPDPEEIGSHRVVFLCEDLTPADCFSESPGSGPLVLDLARVLPRARLAHVDLLPVVDGLVLGPLAVPHPVSLMLAELLHPMHRTFGIVAATAFVLRPAADYGERGLEELREQTIRLLRFDRPPREVFRRQLAFNVIPQRLLNGGGIGEEERVEDETVRLLGVLPPAFRVALAAVPVFHGHCVSLHVRLQRKAAAADLLHLFSAATGLKVTAHDGAATPLGASEDRETSVSEVTGDDDKGFRLWAIASEVASGAAKQAVRLAQAVAGL